MLHCIIFSFMIDSGQKTLSDLEVDKPESSTASPRASKIARHHSPATDMLWGPQGAGNMPMKRYVEGSDSSIIAAPVVQGGAEGGGRRSKRNITSESAKEEEKRELMR